MVTIVGIARHHYTVPNRTVNFRMLSLVDEMRGVVLGSGCLRRVLPISKQAT